MKLKVCNSRFRPLGLILALQTVLYFFFLSQPTKSGVAIDTISSYVDVTLIIPLTFKYFLGHCIENVLDSHLRGTRLPKQMILVVSEFNFHNISHVDRLESLTKTWKGKGLNLTVLGREGKHAAGSNRNFGLSIRSQPIVSFFDVDDVPHPQRIEIISKFFNEDPDMDGFLHGYTTMNAHTFPYAIIPLKTITIHDLNKRYTNLPEQLRPPYAKYYEEHFFNVTEPKGPVPWCCELVQARSLAHNGWSSWRYHVFDRVLFDPNLLAAQDSMFNMKALWAGYNLKVSAQYKLGFYNRFQERKFGTCPRLLLVEE